MKKLKSPFYIAIVLVLMFLCIGVLNADGLYKVVGKIEDFTSTQFGWFYLLTTSGIMIFLIILAFSKFGKIKLGKPDDKPEFNNFTWFAFLFSTGTGIGLVFYGVAEPLIHYNAPPIGEGGTLESATVGLRYAFFHYGLNAWTIFACVGLALAYFRYKKGTSGLFSSMFYPIFGDKVNGPLGKAIDTLVILATVFGVATSLGFGTVQIGGGINYLFPSIDNNYFTQVSIIGIATVFFLLSSLRGLRKGMKYFSEINIILSLILLIFIFIVGNPSFIMNVLVNGTGDYFSNLLKTSFFIEPFDTDSNMWVQGWTVFYWAWYISWAPYVGSFIARVSKGRTIREFIIGTLIAPTIFGIIWFSVFGGTGLKLQMLEGVDLVGVINNMGVEYALFAMLENYPIVIGTSILAIVLLFTYFIASADSATYILSMQSSDGLAEPINSTKIIWGVVISSSAAVLLYVGGLPALRDTMIITALPVVILMILMQICLIKAIKQDYGKVKVSVKNAEKQVNTAVNNTHTELKYYKGE